MTVFSLGNSLDSSTEGYPPQPKGRSPRGVNLGGASDLHILLQGCPLEEEGHFREIVILEQCLPWRVVCYTERDITTCTLEVITVAF